MSDERKWWAAHENQRGVEILVVLLDIVRIVFGRLLLVNGVEIQAGIVVLNWRQKCAQSILDADSVEWSGS